MSVSSDANDSADIFWPGYVDAISNLAINLLFVIAVMAIVVIGATLQINELLKRKDRALADDVSYVALETKKELRGSGKREAKSSTSADSQQQKAYSSGASEKITDSANAGEGPKLSAAGEQQQRTPLDAVSKGVPQSAQQTREIQQKEKVLKQQSEQIKQLTEQLRTVEAQLSLRKTELAKTQSTTKTIPQRQDGQVGTEKQPERVETVSAAQTSPSPEGKNATLVVQGGVIVNFSPNVTQLGDAEAKEIIEKMTTFAPVKSNKWKIVVVVPKGFTEALRLGYYRANAVRNVLLQNGVSGANIEMQVLESMQPSADNARVVIRLTP